MTVRRLVAATSCYRWHLACPSWVCAPACLAARRVCVDPFRAQYPPPASSPGPLQADTRSAHHASRLRVPTHARHVTKRGGVRQSRLLAPSQSTLPLPPNRCLYVVQSPHAVVVAHEASTHDSPPLRRPISHSFTRLQTVRRRRRGEKRCWPNETPPARGGLRLVRVQCRR